MARGGESNILGAMPPAKKRQVAKKSKKKATKTSNILFSSSHKPNNDIYAAKPTALAKRKAKGIASHLQKGDPLPLLLALKKMKYEKGKSPAFDAIFSGIALQSINKFVKGTGLSNKEIRTEKKDLRDSLVSYLAEGVLEIFRKDMPTADKVKEIHDSFSDPENLLLQTTLKGQSKGQIADLVLSKIAMTPLEDLSESDLSYISRPRSSEKDKAILQEIIERQAVALIKRNLPYNPGLSRDLEYAVIRHTRKGPGLLHLVKNRKTLCGKYGIKRRGLSYGDWVDGVRSGRYRQCSKCKKNADPGLLIRVEAERSNLGQDILPLEAQEEVKKIASDKQVTAMIRKSLREGKKPYEISENIDAHMIRRLARTTAKAADMSVSDNPRGKVFEYGKTHILWGNVDSSLLANKEIRGTGYRSPYETRELKEDLLLHLTTEKERRDALLANFLGNETANYQESEKWHKKSSLILNRAIRRAIRNKKKEKSATLF
jgi:hypothetical protein